MNPPRPKVLDRARSFAGGHKFVMLATLLAWTMVLLFVVPGDLNYDTYNATTDNEGNIATRILQIFVLAASLFIVVTQTKLVKKLIGSLNIYFIGLIALSVVSLVWSVAPDVSIHRLMRMPAAVGISLTIGMVAWSPYQFQKIVGPVITFVMLGSLLFGLVNPELAIHHEPSPELYLAWHGLTTQKNILGNLAGFGFILAIHGYLSRSIGMGAFIVSGGSALACLILSHSSTSMFATIAATSILIITLKMPAALRRFVPLLVSLVVLVAIIYALAMLNVIPGLRSILSPISSITGKDLTFSGRTAIWEPIAEHIKLRPILGSGFGAYWAGPIPSSESYVLLKTLYWYPSSVHNGILDIINDLGFVGLALLMGYLIVYLRDALRLYKLDRNQGVLFIAILLSQMIMNLSESIYFNVTNLDFVLMAMSTAFLARSLVEMKSRRFKRVKSKPAHQAEESSDTSHE